jgi:hypothetical protein
LVALAVQTIAIPGCCGLAAFGVRLSMPADWAVLALVEPNETAGFDAAGVAPEELVSEDVPKFMFLLTEKSESPVSSPIQLVPHPIPADATLDSVYKIAVKQESNAMESNNTL